VLFLCTQFSIDVAKCSRLLALIGAL